jgi:two-component sensor histidine kinase
VLVQELNHRVKNSLAIVQAMAVRTLRSNEDIRAARELLEGRLVAFAKAHGVLLKSNWQGGSIQDVLSETIPPFWLRRVQMEGPEVFLTTNPALKVSMAIFELTTNAIKYGALSNEVGYIAINWSVAAANGGGELELTWTEHQGPPVEQPMRKGFGSQILERVLTQDLDAEVLVDYRPTGLRAEIKIVAPDQSRQGTDSAGKVFAGVER